MQPQHGSQADIVSRAIRKVRVAADSRHTKAAPNLLNREFAVDRPNQCWVSDITFISTREGWLYLAVVMDLHSRAIVGRAMGKTLDARLAIDALTMAIHRRGTGLNIAHSARGSTYAAADYRTLLGKHGIEQSLSRKGDCWDHAPVEGFFHTLKTELVMHCDYKTREHAKSSLFDYMEVFYNRQRRHSTTRYLGFCRVGALKTERCR